MNNLNSLPQRHTFGRLSIVSGNAIQLAGITVASLALAAARSAPSKAAAIIAMITAWLLLYFFCHGIAHWAVGRLLGIRFAFYTIGGTGKPEGESNHVVGGSDLLRPGSDPGRDLRVAFRCPRQQTISDLRRDLGDRNLGQQLDEPHRRLLQGAACAQH